MTNLYQRLNALSPEQKALLQKRLQGKGININNSQTIPIRQAEEQIPLSFIQERLWFLHQLQPDLSVYNESILWRIKGELNHELLIASVNKIIQRHEILRTNFQLIDNQIITIINPELKIDIPLINVNSPLPILKETANQPFNLSEGALIRGIIVKINPQEYLFLLVMHHIIYDGWSSKILLQELTSFYNQCSNLSPLPIQYADFALWQRNSFTEEKRLNQLNYWKKQLANPPSLLNLPTDYSRPTKSSFRGQKSFLKLSRPISQALKSLSQTEGVTLFMVLLTAFNILLHRYTGDRDILVGTPISQRQQPEIEGLIGCFLNTLVLRTKFTENHSFRELLTQVRQTTLEAYNYADIPFSELVQELQPNRSLNHSPLFQVMFVFQDSPLAEITTSDLTLTPEIFDSGSSKFDISVFLENTPKGIMGVWEYSSDLFKPETIDRMLQHFQILLEGIVTHPEASINTLPLLTETEKQQFHQWNQTQADFPEQCLHQLFEEQVAKTPDAVISYQLTYKELNEKADRLAAYLQQEGVKPEVLVGICLERSLNLIITLLAVMKAGGAYLPLDPNYPPERLNFIVEDAQPLIILTESTLKLKLQTQKSQIIYIDTIKEENINYVCDPQMRSSPRTTNHELKNLAYVIYTSGSTGKPKGVEITQRSQVEKTLASLWQKALNLEEIGINDNFFELGGHSILMVQLHRQICEEFTIEFPLMEMFKHSTINLLAKLIERTQKNKKEGDTNESINDKIAAGKQRRNQAFLQRKKAHKYT